jgi:hypothetical protein
MLRLTREQFRKARSFILCNARIVERRLFDYHFNAGPEEGVLHAVLAYQNRDGGFGHGMEPDTSSPESQPLFTVMALEALDEAACLNREILAGAMPYIQGITSEEGGTPWMFRPRGDYPRAAHFEHVSERPTISSTGPLLALMLKHGLEHAWMARAEEFVWEEIERQGDEHIRCYLCTRRRVMFLEQTADRERARAEIENLRRRILSPGVLCTDRSSELWGLYDHPNSLSYAPFPDSTLRYIFSDHQVEDDLDETIRRQQVDGRWGTNYGISEGSRLEWDGIETLAVLKTLRAYGRIAPDAPQQGSGPVRTEGV